MVIEKKKTGFLTGVGYLKEADRKLLPDDIDQRKQKKGKALGLRALPFDKLEGNWGAVQ